MQITFSRTGKGNGAYISSNDAWVVRRLKPGSWQLLEKDGEKENPLEIFPNKKSCINKVLGMQETVKAEPKEQKIKKTTKPKRIIKEIKKESKSNGDTRVSQLQIENEFLKWWNHGERHNYVDQLLQILK